MLRRSAEPAGTPSQSLSDEDVVGRVLAGESALFEILMRRYNQRLFRAVRAVVPSDTEAEDVLQEAYVRAFHHLAQFEGRAKFSTWLTRIAIHDALARRRRDRRLTSLDDLERQPMISDELKDERPTPEQAASSGELRGVIDRAMADMPESLRMVFMLRDVEGLDTDETADCLGISAANVKVRLHRARAALRNGIDERLGAEVRRLHQFAGERCDRIVDRVLSRIAPDRA